jgi:hypothetical protein
VPVVIWNFGLFVAVLIVMVGATGVAKITYRQLKGDDFYGASDAWKFALDNGRSVVSTPLILLVLFGLVSLSLLILGLVTRIPAVGPVLFGISVIPATVVAFLGVYLLIALLLSLVYVPAIIGTTGDDGLEGVIQVLSMLWSRPWRTAGYLTTVLLATGIGVYLLSIVVMGALALAGSIIGDVYGVDFANIVAGISTYLPPEPVLFESLPDWFWPGPIVSSLPVQRFGMAFADIPTGSEAIGSFLGGISVLVVMGVVFSYGISSLVSGTTASYLVLRKLKDGEILLDWIDDVDELEDHAAGEPEASISSDPSGEMKEEKGA